MGKLFITVLAGVLMASATTYSAVTGSDSRTSPTTGGSSRTGTTTGSDSDMDTTNDRLYPTYTDKTQQEKDALRKSRRAKSGGQMIPTDEAGPSSVGSGPDSDINVQPSPSPGSRF